MAGVEFLEMVRSDLAGRCPEPVEVALLAHEGPNKRKKLFGPKTIASRMKINNYLVLTPTSVRLYALGGRTAMAVKDELGAWPRNAVTVTMQEAERSSYFADTGSLDYKVFCIHLVGPDLDLFVDVRSDAGMFGDEDFLNQTGVDAEVQEAIDGIRQEQADLREDVTAFVRALTPRLMQ